MANRRTGVPAVLSVLTTAIAALVVASCDPSGLDLLDLYVGAEKMTCYGPFERQCLLVRENPSADWELFYDEIRGFDWEPGYEWKLHVARGRVSKPAQDQSAYTWQLVAVLSKTRDAPGGTRRSTTGSSGIARAI